MNEKEMNKYILTLKDRIKALEQDKEILYQSMGWSQQDIKEYMERIRIRDTDIRLLKKENRKLKAEIDQALSKETFWKQYDKFI